MSVLEGLVNQETLAVNLGQFSKLEEIASRAITTR
jgi:hypothetical protein